MVETDSKRRDSSCQQAGFLPTAGDEERAAVMARQPGHCHMVVTVVRFGGCRFRLEIKAWKAPWVTPSPLM